MNDYLEVFRKFKDIKEISDYVDEVEKLRLYFRAQQYEKMQEHIISLTKKYFVETLLWNSVNQSMPITYQQSYVNAENFMQLQGAKLVVEKVMDFQNRLSQDEISFIESMIKSME